MSAEFLGDRLRLARLMRGYTLQELGTAASVTRQNIHQLEANTRTPNIDVVQALAEFLEVETSFFSTPLVSEVKPEQCHFRKRKTTPVGIANRVIAYSTLFEQVVAILQDKLNLPPADFDFADKHGFDTSNLTPKRIEELAETAREYWELGTNCPIESMVNVLEYHGAVVTCFDDLSDKVDALSVNRQFPIVIRNKFKTSACRMRFDLAHECGHFVMHDGIETGDNRTESEANSFASAFLMPRAPFMQEFQYCFAGSQLNWEEIFAMKLRWKVSARAIIYRAHYLRLITAQQYRGANVHLNRSGQARKEKYDDTIPLEEPEMLEQGFKLLNNELQITFSDVAHKLGVSLTTLSHITGLNVPSNDRPDNVVPISF